ncbi:hypothetical protein SLH46_17825 [Draconibacterium sp. IB214405]|uniref:hypothetical protein n=1 Tax=Draconibacterium sp. IB214405 TaxID=3097352 RepID=UPI002A0CC5EF|nr:hypothetical protein [Draconibacterium sp. IB214405]MDX8341062.1 hypothetical protein [Draconibacterium sp. IB214405]
MVQEIITYLIVAAAVIWAGVKIYNRFFKKASKKKQVDFKKDKITMAHNCSDCAASDCALRDLPQKVIDKNIDQCNETAVRSQ